MMVQIGSITAFGLLSLASQAMAQTTVKVMPFGASIVTVRYPHPPSNRPNPTNLLPTAMLA
jgi:hypothetical protein